MEPMSIDEEQEGQQMTTNLLIQQNTVDGQQVLIDGSAMQLVKVADESVSQLLTSSKQQQVFLQPVVSTDSPVYLQSTAVSTTEVMAPEDSTLQGHVIAEQGHVITEQGQVIAEQGHVITEQGQVIAEQGHVITEQGHVIAEQTFNATVENGTSSSIVQQLQTDTPQLLVTADGTQQIIMPSKSVTDSQFSITPSLASSAEQQAISETAVVNSNEISQPLVQVMQPETPELDPQFFMDVITAYKCKFCNHVSHSPQGMNSHVRHVHLSQDCKQIITPISRVSHKPKVTGIQTVALANSVPQTVPAQMPAISVSQLPEQEEPQTSISVVNTGGLIQTAETPVQVQTTQTVTTGTAMEQDFVNEPSKDVGVMEDESREVFLCGQCTLGFIDIEECKRHMEEEHGLNMTSAVTEMVSEVPAASGGKVDASTQVERKKPGRKPKIKKDEDSANSVVKAESSNDKDNRPDSPFSDDALDDQDNFAWPSRQGEGKRQVRPPKALTDDYYIVVERARMPSEMKKKATAAYKLRCSHPNCMAKFKTQEGLQLHESCHVEASKKPEENKSEGKNGFRCVECQVSFEKWPQLKLHLWKDHQKDADLYQCEDCDYKADALYRLELHREIHNEDKPFICVCNLCDKSFKQQSQLNNHKATCHGVRAPPTTQSQGYDNRKCNICQRTFCNAKSLKNHIEIVHNKVKPYMCPYCDHTAARKAMMEMHIRKHTGEKPYKCEHCPFVTSDHNSLRRHKMRHTGEKQYKCLHCPYSCIQAISLKTHMKSKHPGSDGVYTCEPCNFKSVSKLLWESHMQDHKSGLISDQPPAKKMALNLNELIQMANANQNNAADKSENDPVKQEPTATQLQPNSAEAQLICSAISAITQQISQGNIAFRGTPDGGSSGIGNLTFEVQQDSSTGSVLQAGGGQVYLIQSGDQVHGTLLAAEDAHGLVLSDATQKNEEISIKPSSIEPQNIEDSEQPAVLQSAETLAPPIENTVTSADPNQIIHVEQVELQVGIPDKDGQEITDS